MVRINKHALPKKVEARLFEKLDTTIARLTNEQAHEFLSELFGPEEHLMFAKRLTAIMLLAEGYTRYRVALVLKLSKSTVEHLQTRLEQGNLDHILLLLHKNKRRHTELMQELGDFLLLGGILPGYGSGNLPRWRKRLDKMGL